MVKGVGMKKIIIIQNSSVFTIDIRKIFYPEEWTLELIVNQKGYACVCERDQQSLFGSITITDDFDLPILSSIIKNIISSTAKSEVRIVTNTEGLVSVAGKLRELFDIPGLHGDGANNFSDKIQMKETLGKYNIPVPKYSRFDKNAYLEGPDNYVDAASRQFGFPIITKPVNSAGCRGVIKIFSRDELKRWADSVGDSMHEMDEFVEGDLYHCDSFVHHGRILHTAVCRYSTNPHMFCEGEILGSITLPNDSIMCQKLVSFNNRILEIISHSLSGVTHSEIFVRPNGELVFLEVANRGGGAGLPAIYNKHLNVDIFSMHILLQCKDQINLKIDKGPYAAWLQFPLNSNIFAISSLPSIKSNIKIIKMNDPDRNQAITDPLRRFTVMVLLWNDDYDQLQHDFDFLSLNDHLKEAKEA